MISKKKCIIEGCNESSRKLKMCLKHYSRLCRNGSIETLIEMHGKTDTRIYHIWQSMKQRCLNRNHTFYKYYGGRGISVCEIWRHSFMAFYRDMGDPPSQKHQIDRVNNNQGYSADNCRWVLPIENVENRTSTKLSRKDAHRIRLMKQQGMNIPEIALKYNVKPKTIANILCGNRWKEAVAVH